MIIVPPREWYKTILIQLQFEYVFIFILVVEKNGKKLCVLFKLNVSSDGFCCVYFLLLLRRLNAKFQTIWNEKATGSNLFTLMIVISLLNEMHLTPCKLICCYIERMNERNAIQTECIVAGFLLRNLKFNFPRFKFHCSSIVGTILWNTIFIYRNFQ